MSPRIIKFQVSNQVSGAVELPSSRNSRPHASPKRKRGTTPDPLARASGSSPIHFPVPPTLAYFLTWTTHATWLHGDDRGSIDRNHNARDTPPLAPDPERRERARSLARTPPVRLTREARDIVESTIRDHCDHRRWELHALNVRSNHVHVVVRCPADLAPETAMSQIKAWSTRRLRDAGLAGKQAKVWTEHGSTRWIKSDASLIAAIDYVNNHQD